ncbi:ATP-binding protein (plasmid) [Streptomycetaceae bacterium NBC_01309]
MDVGNCRHRANAAECELRMAVAALDDQAAHRLRHSLVTWLRAHVDDDAAQIAALLAGELLANVSMHAKPPRGGPPDVTLSAYLLPGRLVVEVGDTDPRLPMRRAHGSDDEGGRGLALLDGFATQWAARAHRRGKDVWFTVPATSGGSGHAEAASDETADRCRV